MPRTETEWTRDVVDLALMLGLVAHHHPDSRRALGSRGFPDVVAAGPRGVLFAEIKMPDGDTSGEQQLWLWMLNQSHPGYVKVWIMPSDLTSGNIERDLRTLL